ncbi:MAG TPA: phytanoyl-CoA dioxygenase family protein [Pirellulales bacterium]|nr:phytanoyl-CoA dioxygenase family protein [Pirellulales bacterium]
MLNSTIDKSGAGVSLHAAPLSEVELGQYRDLGFVVRRQVFSGTEMADLAAEADRLLRDYRELIDRNNLRCRFMSAAEGGEPLFEVFDPVNDLSPLCERITSDPRLLAIVESIYGEPACLFKEKLIYKLPGATGYQLHQDIPRSWAGFPRTFLTALIPIDPPTDENGCTELFSGYHHDFLFPEQDEIYMLPDDCVDLSRSVKLLLEPGDLAIFHGLTPHRSGPNRSRSMRRAFYVSFNASSDGGDQRSRHYAEFHDFLRKRVATGTPEAMYFR